VQKIKIVQLHKNSHESLAPLSWFVHNCHVSWSTGCAKEQCLFIFKAFNIPQKHINNLYLHQIFAKSLRSFSNVVIKLIRNFLLTQNYLFLWGIGPILIKRYLNHPKHRNLYCSGNSAPNFSVPFSTCS